MSNDEHPQGPTLANALREIISGKESAVEIARKVLDDGKEQVTFAIRQEPVPPVRLKSPPRAHVFHEVGGFGNYLVRYGKEDAADTVVLADVGSETISAVLNEHADLGFEVVTFQPCVHPLMVPWLGFLAAPDGLEVRALAEFVLANRRSIVEPDPRELVMVLGQVRASKHVTLEYGRGGLGVNGLMVETTIQGKSQTQPISLPETIRFRAPLYVETPEVTVMIDLLASAGGEPAHIRVRGVSADLAVLRVETFEAFVAQLEKALPKAIVGRGHPVYDRWEVLPAAPFGNIADPALRR